MKSKLKNTLFNFLPLIAIPAAIFFPMIGSIFSPYTSWILGTLLFFSFFGLDLHKLIKEFKRPMEPLLVSVVILVITPLLVLPIMQHFFPTYQTGALLFMSAPSAISAPAIASIYGGNIAFTALNTIFSSLLSPITVPTIITIFSEADVQVSFLDMTLQLVTLIFIPFFLSLGCSHYSVKMTQVVKKYNRLISLSLLFLLFFGILSPHKEKLIEFSLNINLWLAVLVSHLILFFFAKLMSFHIKQKDRKVSLESNLFFLNVGLAAILAQNYFNYEAVLFIVFCQIIWVLMVGFFRYLK